MPLIGTTVSLNDTSVKLDIKYNGKAQIGRKSCNQRKVFSSTEA